MDQSTKMSCIIPFIPIIKKIIHIKFFYKYKISGIEALNLIEFTHCERDVI